MVRLGRGTIGGQDRPRRLGLRGAQQRGNGLALMITSARDVSFTRPPRMPAHGPELGAAARLAESLLA